MILFTQSTAVLHKHLNDELKILCLLQFFPEVAQNSLRFPYSEKFLSIPGFPGLWPPCLNEKPLLITALSVTCQTVGCPEWLCRFRQVRCQSIQPA